MSATRQSRPNSRRGSRQRSFSASRPSRPSSHQSYRKPAYEQPTIVIESSNERSSESENSQHSERDSEESPSKRQANWKKTKKRSLRQHFEEGQEEDKANPNFSNPSYSLEAHTFACPCGGTLKPCWPTNTTLSRLVTAKIPVFGTPNTVNDLASSISALPTDLHQKLMTYCLDGNVDVQAEVLNVLADMKIEDWQHYDPNNPQLQNDVRERVEERLRNSIKQERPYIFALMGLSMSKGLGHVCELPSFTAILSKVYG